MWELSSTQGLSEEQLRERILQRRRQILVHSYLYYQLDSPVVEDWKYDYFSNDLVDLQEKYPELSKQIMFYHEFKDFDGSSGFDLKYNQPTIVEAANHLLRCHKRKQNKSFFQPAPLSIVEPNEVPI